MPQRPVWRGHLRLALVSCPVALFNAKHERGAIHFNLINPDTGNRIRMVTRDAGTDQEVSRRDLVKGYEFKKDHYLILTDEDFDSVRVESSSTMVIEKFVDAGSIDPIFFDASYYVAPDGEAGEDVYAVLREAIGKAGRIALSRVVIAQRERVVGLRPTADGGLVAHTLHEQRDIHGSEALFETARSIRTDPDLVTLATQLIERQTGRYDPADFEDRYEARLRTMIDAKLKGEGIDAQADEPDVRDNVIDLMAALKKSLGQGGAATPKPAAASGKAKAAKPAPKKRAAAQATAAPPRKRA